MTGLVRYRDPAGGIRVGVVDGRIVRELAVPDMASVLRHRTAEIRQLLDRVGPTVSLDEVTLLAPIDGRTEVWGAGVTYLRSRAARAEESRHERVYLDVYDADRPELFFKSVSWRVRADGETVGQRADCDDSVAEPELALVLNRYAEIVGALVCNDLTARGVEAQNPIYLPQAKLFEGGCSLSTAIVPWWTLDRPEDLGVSMTVDRCGEQVFAGQTRTSSMKRSYAELADWLFRAEEFPDGVILSTGTGIVPDLGDGLRPGDVVRVEIEQVGSVTNTMTSVGSLR